MLQSWEEEEEGQKKRRWEVLITTDIGQVMVGRKIILGEAGHSASRNQAYYCGGFVQLQH